MPVSVTFSSPSYYVPSYFHGILYVFSVLISPVILSSWFQHLLFGISLIVSRYMRSKVIGIYSSSVKKTCYKDIILFSLQILDLSCPLIPLPPVRLVASCFGAFQECLGIAGVALLFAVHISSRVSLFPCFISPVTTDASSYGLWGVSFPFEGYMLASNNLFNHTSNEMGYFLHLSFLFCMGSLLIFWYLWVFFAW